MSRLDMGNILLMGLDAETWSKPNMEDLVALEPRSSDDGFSSELTLRLVHFYNSIFGRYIHVC